MSKQRKAAPKESRLRDIEIELSAYINGSDSERESLMEMLKMFYRGAIKSQIGIAKALNKTTGEEELILVGVERHVWGSDSKYPIARLLNVDEIDDYQFPDGNGGFVDKSELPMQGPLQ